MPPILPSRLGRRHWLCDRKFLRAQSCVQKEKNAVSWKWCAQMASLGLLEAAGPGCLVGGLSLRGPELLQRAPESFSPAGDLVLGFSQLGALGASSLLMDGAHKGSPVGQHARWF